LLLRRWYSQVLVLSYELKPLSTAAAVAPDWYTWGYDQGAGLASYVAPPWGARDTFDWERGLEDGKAAREHYENEINNRTG
jgi:hypothetical protein